MLLISTSATASVNWYPVLMSADLDEKVEIFTNSLIALRDRYVPIKTISKPDSSTPWLTWTIKNEMNKRDVAYGIWRNRKYRNKKDELWEAYRKLRNRVNGLKYLAQKDFCSRKFDLNLSSKVLYQNLRKEGVYGDELDPELNVNLDDLNEYFTDSNSVASTNVSNFITSAHFETFKFECVTEEEVFNVLCSIKSNATGCDGLSPKFIKIILPLITPVIKDIYNFAILNSSFPNLWKQAKVVPFPKVTNPLKLSDHRPISVLSYLSKGLEKVLFFQFQEHNEQNRLLSNFQSGFRRRFSTTTALAKVTEDICRGSGGSMCTVMVLLDFSKAFDSIPHRLLLDKLAHFFHFSPSAINLIGNFLSDRSQVVVFNGSKSKVCKIKKGVPQGSIKSPIMFSGYINDLVSLLKCSFHLYADDLQIYKSGPIAKINEIISDINNDIQEIVKWCGDNALSLNASKSQAIIFHSATLPIFLPKISINGEELPFLNKVKNLGLLMSENLSWRDQVNSITRKTFGTLKLMRPFSKFFSLELRKRLVLTIIVPHFTYCDIVFYPSLSSMEFDRLRVAFNACVRFVFNLNSRDHVSNRVPEILGLNLSDFFKLHLLQFMFKVMHFSMPQYLRDFLVKSQSHRTNNLIVPYVRNSWIDKSCFKALILLWNGLDPPDRRLQSLNEFKMSMVERLRTSD